MTFTGEKNQCIFKFSVFVLAVNLTVVLPVEGPDALAQTDPLPDSNTNPVCPAANVQHWDKIIFSINNTDLAKRLNLTANTELDVKIMDDPNTVANIKQKLLEFLKVPNFSLESINILDVEYSIVCSSKAGTLPLPPDGDADGDGLLNSWEQSGVDANGDGQIDLILPGADPLHKDLYVEIDFMQFHTPRQVALNHVIGNFSLAPISNPDGTNGINLHTEVDEQVPHQATIDTTGLVGLKNTNFGSLAQRTDPNNANIISAKELVYHYGLFAHSQPGTSSSGISNGIPAMEFMVTLGSPGWGVDPATGHTVGSLDQQEGTFMHELGHNIDLRHGGIDHINCKPNYLSVMTYARQFSSLIGDRPLDYSRSSLSTLNEANLISNAGVSSSTPPGIITVYGPPSPSFTATGVPVDWNDDGDTIDNGVGVDINNLGFGGCQTSPNQILQGHNDWNNILYTLGSPGMNAGFEAAPHEPEPQPPEITIDIVREQRLQLLDGINDAIAGLPSNTLIQPSSAQGIKSNLTNATQPETGTIASFLEEDDIDSAIDELSDLRTKTDSSVGGSAADDLISAPSAQQEVVPLIDNLITVLEKQK
jgi:hypothetical protein